MSFCGNTATKFVFILKPKTIKPSNNRPKKLITHFKPKTTLIMINQGSDYEHKGVRNTGRAKTE